MGVSQRSKIAVVVALLAALAMAFPAFARPDRADIVLTRTGQVGGSSVQPGSYQLVFDGNKVSFLHSHKVVAEANGEWKKADAKAEYTSVRYDENGRISEIRLHGRDSYFVIR